MRSVLEGDDRKSTRRRLWLLVIKIIREISVYSEAVQLYNEELTFWKALGRRRSAVDKKKAKSAIHFLNYLWSYISVEDLWHSWSPAGTITAANRMGTVPDTVARTTNHLESFNGRIKNKYFKNYEYNGRLPRLDHWIRTLVVCVLPDFFDSWLERRQQLAYYNIMHYALKPNESAALPVDSESCSSSAQPLTVAEVTAAATLFMQRAFNNFTVRTNLYATTFVEEHRTAIIEFEMEMEEWGETEDDGPILIEDAEILAVGSAEADEPESESGKSTVYRTLNNEPRTHHDDAESTTGTDGFLDNMSQVVQPPNSPSEHSSDSLNGEDFPFPSAQPCLSLAHAQHDPEITTERRDSFLDFSMDGAALDESRILPDISGHHNRTPNNNRATATMMLQRGEDEYLKVIRSVMQLGLKEDDISEYLSPNLQSQMKLQAFFNDESDPEEPPTPSTASASSSQSSVLPPIKLPPPGAKPGSLGRQTKSRRKECRGIRG